MPPLDHRSQYNIGPTSMSPDEIGLTKTTTENLKKIVGWEEYYEIVKKVKNNITLTPNIIISIGKGGSIPGVILAEEFECNNLNLGLRSYKGRIRSEIQEYQGIESYEGLRDTNILVVDDIADSGKTFKYAINKLKGYGCERVQTASVFHKKCSSFRPDYIGLFLESDCWIVQPWEKLD